MEELDRDSLELVLRALEESRDWVSKDVAAAAMQAAREKRSLDAFISELQAEVAEAGQIISEDFDMLQLHLQDQSEAYARDKQKDMAQRAESLLSALEEAAPPSFRNRNALAIPPQKSPLLPRGAKVFVAGTNSALGEMLTKMLTSLGHVIRRGPDSCPANFADPTLPPSYKLRREVDGADAIVLVCEGICEGGVNPTYLTCLARVLPPSLRRVLIVSPPGVDRTLDLRFAFKNLLGQLDRQRAAADELAVAARKVSAATTVMYVEVGEGPDDGVRIAAGDALAGGVSAKVAALAVREALSRAESVDKRFSLGPGGNAGAVGLGPTATAAIWDDEFLKLQGPEIGRFATEPGVSAEFLRDWARRLQKESGPGGTRSGLLSSFVVVDLPTAAARAAAKRLAHMDELPMGARIRFLASGAEYVGEEEEERMKGDFDGAIDLLVEERRVRVVRAEMEPVFRRGKDGSRIEVTPLVKVESEARLLARLDADLRAEGLLW